MARKAVPALAVVFRAAKMRLMFSSAVGQDGTAFSITELVHA